MLIYKLIKINSQNIYISTFHRMLVGKAITGNQKKLWNRAWKNSEYEIKKGEKTMKRTNARTLGAVEREREREREVF